MHVVIIIILLLCIMNTLLLMKHMHKFDKYHKHHLKHYKEDYFEVGPTSTRAGPYEGITSCSSWGKRNVRDPNAIIGDDSSIFFGSKVKVDDK